MKYLFNNVKKVTGGRRFKCYDCDQRFGTYEQLVKHAEKYHKELIGDEDINKYLYDKRNPGDHLCVICKVRPQVWQAGKMRYYRYCDNPECRKKARENFRKNMKRIYNTDNLLNDPERQASMLANRSIAGTFKWKSGATEGYIGKYELDFLQYCENKLGLCETDIIAAPPSTFVKYYDPIGKRERYYIPDYFYPAINLIIEIKDGSKYPLDSKAKTVLKEKEVIKQDAHNYIKIVEKDYDDFNKLIEKLKQMEIVENKKNVKHIFIIPEK